MSKMLQFKIGSADVVYLFDQATKQNIFFEGTADRSGREIATINEASELRWTGDDKPIGRFDLDENNQWVFSNQDGSFVVQTRKKSWTKAQMEVFKLLFPIFKRGEPENVQV